MKISNFLAAGEVLTSVAAADKQQLLSELADKAAAAVGLPADLILEELRRREELGSTGMGGGVAIPHARFGRIGKPFGMLLRLKKPIDFDAVDNKPVDTVFLLLLPEAAAGDHLGALASVARKLRNKTTIAAVRRALTGLEIYKALTAD
jgi:nitrogen PTS system EIIA component